MQGALWRTAVFRVRRVRAGFERRSAKSGRIGPRGSGALFCCQTLMGVMPSFARHPDRQRLAAGAVTLAAHLLMGILLLSALTQTSRREQARSAPAFAITDVPLAPPPPPPPPRHSGSHRSASAPPGPPLASTPALAPPAPVIIPAIVPPTPVPGDAPAGGGLDSSGTGGGGGTGNGSGGNGVGGGGAPPERIGGHISDRDYPRALSEVGISGTVSVRYRVGIDGRASDCRVTRSSASDALDSLTCGLIVRRFRFRPARDGEGRPVPSTIIENHSWTIPVAPSGESENLPHSQR